MKLIIVATREVAVHAYHETDSVHGDLQGNFMNEISLEEKDWDDEVQYITARIGGYYFDIEELENYSDTVKEFLEDIMMNDKKKKLKAFCRLANSDEKGVLMKDDIDLKELIKKYKKLKTQDTLNNF